MIEHLRALGIVSLVRAYVELAIGGYVVLVAANWGGAAGPAWPTWPPVPHPGAEPQPFDRAAFFAIGSLLIVLFAVRSAQALGTLRRWGWARRGGLVLALIDFATPLTLPFALWGLVVYRHPDSREHFARRS